MVFDCSLGSFSTIHTILLINLKSHFLLSAHGGKVSAVNTELGI